MKINTPSPQIKPTASQIQKIARLVQVGIAVAMISPGVRAQVPAPPSDSETWGDFVRGFEAAAAAGTSGMDFELHKGGGTSVYMKAVWQGSYIGAILPENSATKPDGEVVSFRVAEALGFPQSSQPAAYMAIRGHALDFFRAELSGSKFRGQKEQNRNAVLRRIKDSPDGIAAVFKQWLPQRRFALDSLVSPTRNFNGGLRADAQLAKYLNRTGPMPGDEPPALREFPDNQTPARELAAQLSNILVADAIVGQWDRFSGGNIQAYNEGNDRVRLVALDNGGASLGEGSSYLDYFKKNVTRFDKQTVRKLSAIADFLKGNSANFSQYRDAGLFLESLGVPESKRQRFAKRLEHVAEHVRANAGLPGGTFE